MILDLGVRGWINRSEMFWDTGRAVEGLGCRCYEDGDGDGDVIDRVTFSMFAIWVRPSHHIPLF